MLRQDLRSGAANAKSVVRAGRKLLAKASDKASACAIGSGVWVCCVWVLISFGVSLSLVSRLPQPSRAMHLRLTCIALLLMWVGDAGASRRRLRAVERAALGWEEADSSEGEIVAGRQWHHDSDSADDEAPATAADSLWSQTPEVEQPGQLAESIPPAGNQALDDSQDGPPIAAVSQGVATAEMNRESQLPGASDTSPETLEDTSRTALITEMAVAIHTALQTSGVHEEAGRQRVTALRRRLQESQDDTGIALTNAESSIRNDARSAQERLDALHQDIQRPLRVVIEALTNLVRLAGTESDQGRQSPDLWPLVRSIVETRLQECQEHLALDDVIALVNVRLTETVPRGEIPAAILNLRRLLMGAGSRCSGWQESPTSLMYV